MRILICNDDGFDAPGIAFLARAAASLSDDCWVVAPQRKWTAGSHHLSFDTENVLTRRGERHFVSSGTPADSVVAAMTVLFAEDGPYPGKPDLVLGGVNDGRNTAEDVAYSGTMSIAREATFWGVPGIAFSRLKGGTEGEADAAFLGRLIAALWQRRADWWREGHWLSVNLPKELPAPFATPRIGRDKIAGAADIVAQTPDEIRWRIRRGRPYSSTPGDENEALARGAITVVRHTWIGGEPLPQGFAAGLGEAT